MKNVLIGIAAITLFSYGTAYKSHALDNHDNKVAHCAALAGLQVIEQGYSEYEALAVANKLIFGLAHDIRATLSQTSKTVTHYIKEKDKGPGNVQQIRRTMLMSCQNLRDGL